jgi:Mg2+ and Co2+ transporter CorA
MSRHTENKEELLKVNGSIDLINQRLDTLENNHLAHIQKDIDRILYILGAVGIAVLGELFILLNKVL